MAMIAAGVLGALGLTVQGQAWTWTLYADSAPVVLAQEIPDTPRLNTTLQCEPGSGAVRITLYQPGLTGGFATLSAGGAAATAEAAAGRDGSTATAIRVEHPAWRAFVTGGRLAVAVGEGAQDVTIPADHLPKLRRFTELCGG